MIKKIFILFTLSFLLTSCFWVNLDNANKWVWLVSKNMKKFSLDIPASWEVLSDNSNIIPTPSNWKIALAVTSKNAKNNIYNSLVVLNENIKEKISSSDYSILNNSGSKWEYLSYKEINSKEITFDWWEKSRLYIFSARYNKKTPKLNFLQTWIICWSEDWFFLTIALNSDISDFDKYENILKTFKCN